MFRPAPMMRLSVVVLERDERPVLRELGRLGAVQLVSTPAGQQTAPRPPPDRSREIAVCERIQSRVAELRRSLQVVGLGGESAPPEMTAERVEAELAELESKAHALLKRRDHDLRRRDELDGVAAQVASLRGLNLPLDAIGRSEFLHFLTGSLPEGALARLELGDRAVLLPLPARGARESLLAMTTRSRAIPLDNALKNAGFRATKLSPAEGATADELWARLELERARSQSNLERLEMETRAFAAEAARPLALFEAWAEVERRLLEAEQCSPRTDAAVLITGWAPEAAVPEIRERLLETTGGRCAVEAASPRDVPETEIPVLLRHSRLLRPFELLVSAYGLPTYRELAPTAFVAVSYVLMFGMMFGDVGHGGVLALGGLVLLLASRGSRNRDLGLLFLFNGLSSAAWGVAYGSCFGLPRLKEHALWRDPIEGDPMVLMTLAIGAGVVLMSLGLLLNIANRLRHRQWLDGLLGKFGVMGVVFYWGALALAAKAASIRAHGWWTPALVAFLVLPVVCWGLKEPLEHLLDKRAGRASTGDGLVAAVTESVVGAFEGVLLYLANTVSFVRLAAYAMSHAALLMATFTLAAQVERLSAGGPALGVAVVIGGNLVAMVLEGIVASVQALRLEYYEFFGKFFSGEGQPFTPFRLAAEPT